jgi:hypothetical protein
MFADYIIEALCDRFGISEKYLEEIAEAKEFYLFQPDGQISKHKIPDSFRGETFEPEFDYGIEEYEEPIIIEHTFDYIENSRIVAGASFFMIDKYIGTYLENLKTVIAGEAIIADFEIKYNEK